MSKVLNKPTHGGAREGAGRPTVPGTKRFMVTLTPAQVERAKKLGDGNISAGIKIALDKKDIQISDNDVLCLHEFFY